MRGLRMMSILIIFIILRAIPRAMLGPPMMLYNTCPDRPSLFRTRKPHVLIGWTMLHCGYKGYNTYVISNYKYAATRTNKALPGPPGLPYFGPVWTYLRDP